MLSINMRLFLFVCFFGFFFGFFFFFGGGGELYINLGLVLHFSSTSRSAILFAYISADLCTCSFTAFDVIFDLNLKSCCI